MSGLSDGLLPFVRPAPDAARSCGGGGVWGWGWGARWHTSVVLTRAARTVPPLGTLAASTCRKFVNCMMQHGKKSVSQRILNEALSHIKTMELERQVLLAVCQCASAPCAIAWTIASVWTLRAACWSSAQMPSSLVTALIFSWFDLIKLGPPYPLCSMCLQFYPSHLCLNSPLHFCIHQ